MSILNSFASIDPAELRKEVEKHLQWCYAHNQITIDELEERLRILNSTDDKTRLLSLVEDLPPRQEKAEENSESSTGTEHSRDVKNDSYFAFLGSHTRRGEWDVPQKIDVAAILGSQMLDFRDARFHTGTTVISAFAFMGSVEMKFPPGVRVTSKGVPILGSIENRVQSEASGPLIHIEGFAMLGSINAKTRK